MLARLHSLTLLGIDAIACEVEVDVLSKGMAPPTIVGLPDPAVRESIDRIRSALFNCGYEFPKTRCVINLAPADVRKEGPAFDLPIALGLMMGSRQLASDTAGDYLIAGELALDGSLRPVKGAISMALLARQEKRRGILLPRANAREAAMVEGIEVIGLDRLNQAVAFLAGVLPMDPTVVDVRAAPALLPVPAYDSRSRWFATGFLVRLLHPLLSAGFDRRFPDVPEVPQGADVYLVR